MVSPARRREVVERLGKQFDASERQACRVMEQPRSTQRYERKVRDDGTALVKRIHELVRSHPRYG